MGIVKIIGRWWQTQTDKVRFYLIRRWTEGRGLTIVRIVTVANTDYIMAVDGSLHRIGNKEPGNGSNATN